MASEAAEIFGTMEKLAQRDGGDRHANTPKIIDTTPAKTTDGVTQARLRAAWRPASPIARSTNDGGEDERTRCRCRVSRRIGIIGRASRQPSLGVTMPNTSIWSFQDHFDFRMDVDGFSPFHHPLEHHRGAYRRQAMLTWPNSNGW